MLSSQHIVDTSRSGRHRQSWDSIPPGHDEQFWNSVSLLGGMLCRNRDFEGSLPIHFVD